MSPLPAEDEWDDVDLDDDHFACTDPDCTCHDLDDLELADPPWTTLIPNARYL